MENTQQSDAVPAIVDLWFSVEQAASRRALSYDAGGAPQVSGSGYIGLVTSEGGVYRYSDMSSPNGTPKGFNQYPSMSRVATEVNLRGATFIDNEILLQGALSTARQAGKPACG